MITLLFYGLRESLISLYIAEDTQTFRSIPSVVLVSAYFANKWYKAYQLKVHGIGRGGA
jgi:hypothetical protein